METGNQPIEREPEIETYDVVVVGGGLAGLCAAIASARGGATTALINDRPVLGGNSSSEVRVVPMGASSKTAWSKETGIIEEIFLTDRATNPADFYDNGTMNRMYDLRLYELARSQANLTVFANTSIAQVRTEPVGPEVAPYVRRVVAVTGIQLTTGRWFEFRSEHFIDCTGDGTVGWLGGAEYRLGRESRAEFGEPLAPLAADESTMGSTVCMRAIDYGRPLPYTPPTWAKRYSSPADLGVSDRVIALTDRDECAGFWWIEIGHPYHQVREVETVRDELLAHVLGVWNYMKNHGPDRERLATYGLEWIGMLPGKRESRRLVGDVILTEHHCHIDQRWPDRLTHAGWYIDVHTKGGVLNRGEPGEISHVDESYTSWTHIAPFTIPLRASYSRNIENLWMAGRSLSTSHVALGPVRVMATLGLHGQAVGTAAAMAVTKGLTPREFSQPDGPHITGLHQSLLRNDVHVFDVRNEDPDDVARTARVSASSTQPLRLEPDPGAWERLSQPRAQVVFASTGRIDAVSVYLRNGSSEQLDVRAELQQMDRIWDREDRPVLAATSVRVPAATEGWVTLPLHADVDSARPVRLALFGTEAIAWAHATTQPTGTLAQVRHHSEGGPFRRENLRFPSFQPHETEVPAFDAWNENKWFALAARLTPESQPYTPDNIVNGVAWPINWPNLWIADQDEQTTPQVTVEFESPQRIGRVHLTFDTDLNVRYRDLPALWRAATCARHFRLWGRTPQGWTLLHEDEDNFLRHRVVDLPGEALSSLRVEFVAGQANSVGAQAARLYEIRAYTA